MKKWIIVVIILVAVLVIAGIISLFSEPAPSNAPKGEKTTLAQNLDVPWAMDFLPNGTMIFTERTGKVNLLEDNGTVVTVTDINVSQVTESGLLGVAVDPNFTQNKYIYLYYTHDGGVNRISRFLLNGSLTNETVLLDNIPGGSTHNGGRLKFGPDGKLYATTGEAGNQDLAQNINSTGGKILRMNPDGTVPNDNPFDSYVYSYGHRDPQGLVWSPNGTLYASEHGATMNDEINIITKGGNYGWPIVQGNENQSVYISPIRVYTDFTLAPSGIAFYQDKLYVAGLRGSQLRILNLSSDGKTVTGESVLINNMGRIRDVVEHDGFLYICTSNRDGRGLPQSGDDKIIRIKL